MPTPSLNDSYATALRKTSLNRISISTKSRRYIKDLPEAMSEEELIAKFGEVYLLWKFSKAH